MPRTKKPRFVNGGLVDEVPTNYIVTTTIVARSESDANTHVSIVMLNVLTDAWEDAYWKECWRIHKVTSKGYIEGTMKRYYEVDIELRGMCNRQTAQQTVTQAIHFAQVHGGEAAPMRGARIVRTREVPAK